ncbi:GntR family transcriptional regulator [Pelagibacterium sp.]|uniref:GntR family transcriptional regulator n=1 Tax=Pelagibacterium sp. TaxID=1967288 RepID=UPI003A8ED193
MSTNGPALSQIESTYLRLREEVIAGRIKPGQKLIISELTGRYGASLGAVREALSRLTSEELVTSETQRGFRVAAVSMDDLLDLTKTRIEIESLCLQSALKHGDLEWETNIVATYHRLVRTSELEAGKDDIVSESWAAAHSAFHAALVAGCESRWMLRLQAILYVQSERYRRLSIPLRAADNELQSSHKAAQDRDHKQLMEAALARDEAQLLLLIEAHLQHTADIIMKHARAGGNFEFLVQDRHAIT